jgi:hypothetical protein
MHDYRPKAPDYVQHVLIHEGYSDWWAEDMLTDLSTVDFPAVHSAGIFYVILRSVFLHFFSGRRIK